MKGIVCFTLLLLGYTAAVGQEKPVATTSCDRTQIEIFFKSGQSMPAHVAHSPGDRNMYQLIELEPVDEPGIISRDRSAWLPKAEIARCVGATCEKLQIKVARPLPAGQTFILAIANFTDQKEAITLRFETPVVAPALPKVEITTGPAVFSQPSELQLRASDAINVNATVAVKRIHYEVSSDGLSVVKLHEPIQASVGRATDRLYILKLDKHLVRGKEYFLQVDSGITDNQGRSVTAEGTVKIRAIPSKADELGIDVTVSSDVAVHQRPIFQFVGKYKQTNLSKSKTPFGLWRWEPTASVDVGLRSTKSANAVLFEPLNIVTEFFAKGIKDYIKVAPKLQTAETGSQPTNPTAYANWRHADWNDWSNLKVTVGPKFEFDRNFKRKNILGGLRFDFNFHRWHATLADKRGMFKSSFGEDIGGRTRVRFGMQIIPYIAFDFGGHVNNETVHKKVSGVEKSVFVSRHKIFRSYAGFTSMFEFDDIGTPITITIEEAMVHLASRETIGFTNDDGAFLRSLRGFHHRGKATFAFAVGRSKHYSLVLTYENGRQAPNLEYLNKLATGIKVVY